MTCSCAAANLFFNFLCNYATKGELSVCQVLILYLLHTDNWMSPRNTAGEVPCCLSWGFDLPSPPQWAEKYMGGVQCPVSVPLLGFLCWSALGEKIENVPLILEKEVRSCQGIKLWKSQNKNKNKNPCCILSAFWSVFGGLHLRTYPAGLCISPHCTPCLLLCRVLTLMGTRRTVCGTNWSP